MFFFNGRIRNAHIIPIVTHERSYTHRISQSGIIVSCLLVVIGLVLVIIGAISETDKATFFGIGITSLCLGFLFAILICSYTKLDVCYHNWAYGSHVSPSHMETSVIATAGAISIHYNSAALSVIQSPSLVTVPPIRTISTVSAYRTSSIPVVEHKTRST